MTPTSGAYDVATIVAVQYILIGLACLIFGYLDYRNTQ